MCHNKWTRRAVHIILLVSVVSRMKFGTSRLAIDVGSSVEGDLRGAVEGFTSGVLYFFCESAHILHHNGAIITLQIKLLSFFNSLPASCFI